MPLFPRNHQIIRVQPGGYVDGRWVPAVEAAPTTHSLHLQPANNVDIEMVQSMPGGQNISGLLRGYGGTTAPLKEGDILLYDNARWVVVSAPPARDVLGPDTAHVRYLFTREIAVG
jgi:hypothetical protein